MICHTHILYSSVIYHTSNAWTQKTNWSCKQRVHSRCGRLRRIQTSAKHCRKDFVPPKRLWYIILIYCTWVWCIILPTPETKKQTEAVHNDAKISSRIVSLLSESSPFSPLSSPFSPFSRPYVSLISLSNISLPFFLCPHTSLAFVVTLKMTEELFRR